MTIDPRQELAEFLKTRRTRVNPEDLGLEPGPRRRVAGLRREELALLAGVSTDYYQRMEQGRDVNPSEQVLDAIARALEFTPEESRHLRTLAAAARTPVKRARYGPEAVPGSTLRLLATMGGPALVVGRFLDVLAWNPLAGALLGDFTRLPVEQRNMLFLFLHPEADQTCPDRKATVAELTAMLRGLVAAEPGHPRAEELIAELTISSAEFTELWSRHNVQEATIGQMKIIHPLVGELNLDWDAYPMPGAPGPVVLVFTAPAGGTDAERLQRLADLIAEGNALTSDDQRAKLRLITEVAAEVWG
jgi:transcriptional regulator with XRE-family HTH domain